MNHVFVCIFSRLVDGHIQDFGALCAYMQQFGLSGEATEGEDEERSSLFLTAISDFHLLLFIATMDTLPLRVCILCYYCTIIIIVSPLTRKRFNYRLFKQFNQITALYVVVHF
jgi:hypothetical protein